MRRTNPSLTSTWIGSPVRNSAGETLGKIDELVIDPSSGNISFVVISLGGLLGGQERLIAVPWNALGVMPGRDYVLLNMDKNVLARAPGFDREHWPDATDAEWRSSIHRYYGYPEPAVVRDRPVLVHREERPARKEMSTTAAVFLVLLLAGVLALTYVVSTRGWDQAKVDIGESLSGVSYAMKDTSDDVALTAKVKTSLSLNKRVPSGAINVDSNDGVVTLRGDVPNEDTRLLVENIAKDTPGVQQVRNHLYVIAQGGASVGH